MASRKRRVSSDPMTPLSRKIAAVLVASLGILAAAGQAQAQEPPRGRWHEQHERYRRPPPPPPPHRHYYRPPPVFVAPPAREYYSAPPMVVPQPGINIVIPIR